MQFSTLFTGTVTVDKICFLNYLWCVLGGGVPVAQLAVVPVAKGPRLETVGGHGDLKRQNG